jgi:hypothetical protein
METKVVTDWETKHPVGRGAGCFPGDDRPRRRGGTAEKCAAWSAVGPRCAPVAPAHGARRGLRAEPVVGRVGA